MSNFSRKDILNIAVDAGFPEDRVASAEVCDVIERVFRVGELSTAEYILYMWAEPWPLTQKTFIDRLESYVAELRKENEYS